MENNRLILIGGGGHCKSVIDAAERSGRFQEIVVLDPNLPVGSLICGFPVAGGDDRLPELFRLGFRSAFVAAGSLESTSLREKLYRKAREAGFSFPDIADPSAVVSKHAVIGEGVFIGKNAVINADARIGDHAIINTAAVIEHEAVVGAFSHVAVGARICGQSVIGDRCLVGAGATVIQCVRAGDGAVIGAGSVVLRDMEPGEKNYGVIH